MAPRDDDEPVNERDLFGNEPEPMDADEWDLVTVALALLIGVPFALTLLVWL